MGNSEHLTVLQSGSVKWNQWRVENPALRPDLNSCDLRLMEFTYDSSRSMTIAQFKNVDFSRTYFSAGILRGIRFFECNFTEASLDLTDARECVFIACVFGQSNWESNAKPDKTLCSMLQTRFEGSTFRQCNLCYVDLTSVVVDEKTSFEQADLFRATIAREVLDCMEGGGKLTMHQLRNLKVVDDIATLRREFSGFWVAVHVTGMLIFLAPYLVFVVFQLLRAEVGELQTSIGVELVSDKDTAPFGLNIIRFIASGGKNWRQWDVSFLAIVLTGLAILYNFLRGLLWWKTLSLEHHKLVHGYYPYFSFKGFWKLCFNSYRISFVLSVIVLLVHSLMYLSRPIPV